MNGIRNENRFPALDNGEKLSIRALVTAASTELWQISCDIPRRICRSLAGENGKRAEKLTKPGGGTPVAFAADKPPASR
jgi:hypothetical protein